MRDRGRAREIEEGMKKRRRRRTKGKKDVKSKAVNARREMNAIEAELICGLTQPPMEKVVEEGQKDNNDTQQELRRRSQVSWNYSEKAAKKRKGEDREMKRHTHTTFCIAVSVCF